MTTIKFALCAALLTVTLAAPADAGYRHRLYKPQHTVWIPLFLGVGY